MLPEKTYIICILKILEDFSDPKHILAMGDIQNKLKTIYDIEADRRTVYRNIDALIELGYDISKFSENKQGYYLRERDFEPAELHLLCDAVLSAEGISPAQSKELLEKIQSLGSKYQSKIFNHLGIVKAKQQPSNPHFFYNIELISEAISNQKKIEFDYYIYDVDLTLKPKRNKKYRVNPYAIYWSNSRYYLISNIDDKPGTTHFRLDRIRNVAITDDKAKPKPRELNTYDYASKALFNFGGEVESYTIRCKRAILQDVIDRFGNKIMILDSDDEEFTAVVKATTGGMRLWAIHYIENCRVLSPEWLVNDVKKAISKGAENYGVLLKK